MDVERTMEFILESQATFAANLARLEQKHEQLEGIVGRVVGLCETLTSAQVRFQGNLEQLAVSQERTDAALRELTEKQAATDDRLNALIRVVDDLVRRDIQ